MVMLLRPHLDSNSFPALVVSAACTTFLPLSVALAILAGEAVCQRWRDAVRVGASRPVATSSHSRVLAVMTFLGGVVLLFSGARRPGADA